MKRGSKNTRQQFHQLVSEIPNAEDIIQKLNAFNIAIPSWALGTGGTRFGRFSGGGEPRSLEEKIEDVGIIQALNKSSNAISLHIPWDIPEHASSDQIPCCSARNTFRCRELQYISGSAGPETQL